MPAPVTINSPESRIRQALRIIEAKTREPFLMQNEAETVLLACQTIRQAVSELSLHEAKAQTLLARSQRLASAYNEDRRQNMQAMARTEAKRIRKTAGKAW